MANISTSRKTGFIRRNGVMKRESLWLFATETNSALAAANTAALVGSLNAAALALTPFTIVRTRIAFHARSDQRAASENYDVAIGMAVVSAQASAIGITAVPTPYTDLGSDLWFLWFGQRGRISVTTDVGVLEAGMQEQIDSKAMRKVEDGEDMVITLENSSLSSGSTVFKVGRILIKLH